MIDTVALREKVLDLAIRGKLVPQDPNDEPASVLLERIRAQKQQMVKDGKLKPKDIKDDTIIFVGDDNLHYEKFTDGTVKCIEDEIPFELPAGWVWARINTLCILNPKNTIPDNTTASFVPMPLIKEGYANEHTFEERKWNSIKNGFTHFANNDIGIAKITPCFENRKSVVFRSLSNGVGAGTTELFVVRCINDTVLPDYLLWNFKTQKFIDGGIQTYTGDVGQQRVRRDYVSKHLIALPPHAEQNRIINSISSLFELISSMDTSYAEMSDLVLKTKSKILNLAIRGKLVPQDPSDEPASVLLERIRAEKEELINLGKIKRDKKESVIFRGEDNSYYEKIGNSIIDITDEIPFEPPSNCLFVRFKDVWELLSGRDLAPDDYNDQEIGIPYITGASNFINGTVTISRWTDSPQVVTRLGDLLITCKGTVGETAFNTFGDAHIARQIMAMRNNYGLNIEYLSLCINYYIASLKTAAKGLIPGISREDILNLILPLPSEKYQISVVNRVNELFETIEHIKKSLN